MPVAKAKRAEVKLPAGAKRQPFPKDSPLMLCTLVAEPFDDPQWLFEPKLDGLRVLARYDGKRVNLCSRNDKSQDFQFPDVTAAVAESLDKPAILDGEIVCLDENGLSSFRQLQQRFHLEDRQAVAERMAQYPAYFYVFDILHYAGHDLAPLPLWQRKAVLKRAVKWSDRVRWVEATEGKGVQLLRDACAQAGAGIIGKRRDSVYLDGRSADWVKIKCIGRQEFVVGGFTDPQRSRVGLGALLVGYYGEDGKTLVYAGKVGTGYTRETLLDLRERLDKLKQSRQPFDEGYPPRGPGVHWVKPRLVAEIAFAEWTQNGQLRQPRFEGLRMDKKPSQVKRERAKSLAAAHVKEARNGRQKGDASSGRAGKASPERVATSLQEYDRKRNFGKTPEPPGKKAKPHSKSIFVIQEHHATRLHWDFRLEVNGVLKSWAVTNQPTLDPSIKRLAVQTEDHPMAYADFEGDIPAGQYGAGHVEIWDKGTFDPRPAGGQTALDALGAGKLEFVMHGKRMKGAFVLIRMAGRGRGENWLLMKKKDDAAKRDQAAEAAVQKKAKPAPDRDGGDGGSLKEGEVRVIAGSGKPQATSRTHEERMMFPEAGVTKGDLLDYYDAVADRLLPFLKDRPLTLERLPDGLSGPKAPHFWQKHTPEYYPSWIPRARMRADTGRVVDYVLANDREALLYLVNQGTVTFHPLMSRVQQMDRPDFVLFDLDPADGGFESAVAVAREVHAALEPAGQQAFLKTSGKRGLHILAPWRGEGGHDEARAWAVGIAEQVCGRLPDLATTERAIRKRQGKLYLDVMQNALGRHVVPPYVVRADAFAGVSMPLKWSELKDGLAPEQFTVKTAAKRLAKQKADPLAGLLG